MKIALATVCLIMGVALAPATYAQTAPSTMAPAAKKSDQPVDDTWITTKIKGEYAAKPGVSAINIKVDTKNGVVTLSGDAKDKAEADKAVSIAKDTKGVVSVKNDIKVVAKK